MKKIIGIVVLGIGLLLGGYYLGKSEKAPESQQTKESEVEEVVPKSKQDAPHKENEPETKASTNPVVKSQNQITKLKKGLQQKPITPQEMSRKMQAAANKVWAEPKSRRLEYDVLEGYGEGHPQEDLNKVFGAMEAYKSLVRLNPRVYPPATTNAIFTRSLTGYNKEGMIFVDEGSKFINELGELIDRWGNPLELHFVSSTSIGIRSAGEDGQLYTEDDYHLPAVESVGMISDSTE